MISKLKADYKPATGKERCQNCSMFLPPHKCSLVHGFIRPEDWCKYWESKDEEKEDDGGRER